MKINEIAKIAQDRLNKWRGKMVNNYQTPVILIGVGHGEHNKGQVGVYTVEEISDADIILFLEGAVKSLKNEQSGEVEGPRA